MLINSNDLSSEASGPVLLIFHVEPPTGQENEKWAWSIDQHGCHAFVLAIYIYIGSIAVTCRLTVAKIVLIGNLRWPSSCLCLLYFPATALFTCIKS